MGKDRLYKPRKPWAGEQTDADKVGKDAGHEFRDIETALRKTDTDLDTAQDAADAAQATADTKAQAQHDGAQKTSTGDTINSSSWADLPGNGGSGTVSKTITTVGGTVKASLTVKGKSAGTQDDVEIRIKEDSTDGNVIAGTHVLGTVGNRWSIAVHEIFSPDAGSHTYTARYQVVGGANVDLDEADLTVTEIN